MLLMVLLTDCSQKHPQVMRLMSIKHPTWLNDGILLRELTCCRFTGWGIGSWSMKKQQRRSQNPDGFRVHCNTRDSCEVTCGTSWLTRLNESSISTQVQTAAVLQHQESTGKPSDDSAHGAGTFKLPSLKAERGNELKPNGRKLRTLEGRNELPLSKRQIITDSSSGQRLKKTGARQGSCAAPPQQKSSTSVQLTLSFSWCPITATPARWLWASICSCFDAWLFSEL